MKAYEQMEENVRVLTGQRFVQLIERDLAAWSERSFPRDLPLSERIARQFPSPHRFSDPAL